MSDIALGTEAVFNIAANNIKGTVKTTANDWRLPPTNVELKSRARSGLFGFTSRPTGST